MLEPYLDLLRALEVYCCELQAQGNKQQLDVLLIRIAESLEIFQQLKVIQDEKVRFNELANFQFVANPQPPI